MALTEGKDAIGTKYKSLVITAGLATKWLLVSLIDLILNDYKCCFQSRGARPLAPSLSGSRVCDDSLCPVWLGYP